MLPSTPLTIIVGSTRYTEKKCVELIQQSHCPYKATDTFCRTCSLIEEKKYHLAHWFSPSKNYYTLDDLEPIKSLTTFVADEPVFIIITSADLLSEHAGNSLLKIAEEPMQKFYFVLLTDRPENILPTLHSRAIRLYVEQDQLDSQHDLFKYFHSSAQPNPAEFLKFIDKETPSEAKSANLLEELVHMWLRDAVNKQDILNWYIHQINNMPAPGGAKIFWKRLYIDFFAIIKPLLKNNR